MKRSRSHATRSFFSLPPRRRGAVHASSRLEWLRARLHLGGKSALSLGLAALILIFIGLLMVNFVGQVLQSARLDARHADLEVEVADLAAETVRLAGAVEYTESNVYVEHVARSQLGYAREGDVVVLPRTEPASLPREPEPAPAEETAGPATPQSENWRLWWRAFFPAEG
jgi:cell division protein FtsB